MNSLVFKSFCQVFFVLLSIAFTFQQDSWNYDKPNLWYLQYKACRGRRQSPLDITKPIRTNLNPIKFGLYNESFNGNSSIEIENNGHTIEFQIPSTAKGQPYITDGSLLKDKYKVVSGHFHWGRRVGSEHEIGGKSSDLEMHIIHENALGNLTVLAILFDVSKKPSVPLDEISKKLEDVVKYKSQAKIEKFTKLNSILDSLNRKTFYTYLGSLTTPPCTENVRWIVFPDHLGVDKNMISKLVQVKDSRNYNLKSTIRPIQAKNNRMIYYINPN